MRKYKVENVTNVWKHMTQAELDLYLRNHANPVIKKARFHFPVSITGGFQNLTLEESGFMEGLEMKNISTSNNLTILKIRVQKTLFVWDVLVGGTFRADKSWPEMVPGRGKLSKIQTGALIFRGEILHK